MTDNTQGLDELIRDLTKVQPMSKSEARQAILQWVNDEFQLSYEIRGHLDSRFFDGNIPEPLTTDKEQRAFGHGYNMRGDELKEILKQHGFKQEGDK